MKQTLLTLALLYLAILWTVSASVCLYDKIAAKKWPRHRIRESTLIWLSLLGGGPIQLLTVLGIRHKTQHRGMMFVFWLSAILWSALCLFGLYLYFSIP